MTIALERPVTTDPLTLVDPDVADRLTLRISTEHPDIDQATALRIVGQTAGFIAASAQATQPLAPSQLVDIGWHTFILHTTDYTEFCERVVGQFVHHVPTSEGEEALDEVQSTRERTLAAITAAGYTVDPELWPDLADCSQCHAGCTDSPNSGTGK